MAHPGLVGPPPSCNSPRHPPPPPLLIAFASSGAGRKSRVRRRISFPRHRCCFHRHRHSCKGLVAMDVDAPSPLLPRVGTASSSSSSSPLLRGVQALKSVQSTETDKTEESDDTFLDVEDGRMPKTNKRELAKDIDMYKTKKRGNTGRFLLGVELTPDVVAIAMVYFVQGVLGLSRLAVSFFLKDDLHLDPAETPDVVAIAMVNFIQGVLGLSHFAVSFFLNDDLHLDPAETAVISGVSAVPWLVKPIYGFISDGFPLFGYRRRSYLILCGLLGAMAWAIMATFVDSKYGAMMAILLSSLSVAFSDVVVDSMAVERARGEPQSTSGSIQSLCWGFSAAGGIISAYFSGSLVQLYGVRFVFGVTALLPLMTSAVAVLVSEERTAFFSNADMNKENDMSASKGVGVPPGHVKMQLVHLWKAVKEPSILLPTLFIFLWQATPTSDTAMFFFTTNKLAFGPEFLGRVRLITSVASLAGVAIYNGFLKSVPLRRMFFWTTILGAGLSLTQLLLVTGVNQKLGISNEWFAMGDNLILTVLGQVSFMPILVLAAKLCPPGVEATLFATLMSLCNGGSVTGGLLGAALTRFLGVTSENFDNIALLLIICNSTSLLPLFFLRLLPSEMEVENTADKVEKASKNPRDLKKH